MIGKVQSFPIRQSRPSIPSSIYPSTTKPGDSERDEGGKKDNSKPKPAGMGLKEKSEQDVQIVLEEASKFYEAKTGRDFGLWEEERYMNFYTRKVRKHGAAFFLAVVEAFAGGDEDHERMDFPAAVLMSKWSAYAEGIAEFAEVAAGGAK